MNKKEPSKMLFTEAAVKSMQAEKNNLLSLLSQCKLALIHFPDEQFGSNTIYKSKQLLTIVEAALKKYNM